MEIIIDEKTPRVTKHGSEILPWIRLLTSLQMKTVATMKRKYAKANSLSALLRRKKVGEKRSRTNIHGEKRSRSNTTKTDYKLETSMFSETQTKLTTKIWTTGKMSPQNQNNDYLPKVCSTF